MGSQTKTVKGWLLDQETEKILMESIVVITHDDSNQSKDHSAYMGELTLDGYMPELDSKMRVLKLKGGLSGKVYLSLANIPDQENSKYVIAFNDSVWDDPEWFDAL